MTVLYPEAPVGEIGIDGLREEPPRDVQRQVCIRQLELAVQMQRPVVLHGARAWGELVAVVKPFAPRLPGFVAHAFAGSVEILRELVALGDSEGFTEIAEWFETLAKAEKSHAGRFAKGLESIS